MGQGVSIDGLLQGRDNGWRLAILLIAVLIDLFLTSPLRAGQAAYFRLVADPGPPPLRPVTEVTDETGTHLVEECDVPLGLPFNVTQYATLLCMLAQVCGLKPGTIDWSIKDAHIYVNQIDGIKEQLKRFDEQGDLPAPKLWLNPEVDDFFKFDSSRDCKDVKLIDYKHLGKISFPISQ